ncbi:MAG TPA: response regulator transcription factor [Myxococcota bacterium]|nr:response regulator transcription factor [Myxococcota bacterium]
MTAPAKRILVVEDDDVGARVLHDLLVAHGYEVETARTGSAGLEAWKQERWDLMIVDVLLPVMNGFELCRMVKSARPGPATPVILISAAYRHPERDPAYARRALGADAYLCKPFELDDLLTQVHALVGEA